jgi:hypothetical protein
MGRGGGSEVCDGGLCGRGASTGAAAAWGWRGWKCEAGISKTSEPVDEAVLRREAAWKCSGRRWPGLGLLKRWAYSSLDLATGFSGFLRGLACPNWGVGAGAGAGAFNSWRGFAAGASLCGGSRWRTMAACTAFVGKGLASQLQLLSPSYRLLELPRCAGES